MRSSVSVWASDMDHDWLPPVCWRTGLPADDRLRVTFRSYPSWTALLILVGVIPWLIVRSLSGIAEAVRRNYDERTARAWNLPLTPSVYALNVGPPQVR